MIKNLTAQEVARLLEQDAIVLVDVREPDEFKAGHIKGARLVPLSRFDPKIFPLLGRPVVFHCRSGGRSAQAVALCQRAGVAVDSHMQGGIQAWAAAGFALEK